MVWLWCHFPHGMSHAGGSGGGRVCARAHGGREPGLLLSPIRQAARRHGNGLPGANVRMTYGSCPLMTSTNETGRMLRRRIDKHGLLPAALAVFLLLLAGAHVQAQPLYTYLDDLVGQMPAEPNDSVYTPGNETQRTAWRMTIMHLLEGDVDQASQQAALIGYRIAAIGDGGETYWVLEGNPDASPLPWGVVVIAATPPRPYLVIEAPHAHYDFRTGLQAIRVFKRSGALALYINGTHRCSSPVPSPCDGTTTVCGDGTDQPFRESDQAHAVNGPLQGATMEFLSFNPIMVILQLHGFVREAGDPNIILSNGTDMTPTGTDWVMRLRDELVAQQDTLTFRIAHLDPDWTRFTGTTNVQGRLVNGSPDPCDQAPSSATGRFVHMEQSYDGLRDNEASWERVGDAVAGAFASSEVHDPGHRAELPTAPVLITSSPNPFNESTRLTFDVRRMGRMKVDVFDVMGRHVARLKDNAVQPGTFTLVWHPRFTASGRYTLQVTHDGYTMVHPLVYVK